MAQNYNLYTCFKKNNLSLKELKKKTKISYLRLYFYLYGYLNIKEEHKAVLASALNMNISELALGNGYPEYEETPEKSSSIISFLRKKTTGIASIVITLIAIIFICSGSILLDDANNNTRLFYDTEYLNAITYVRENGEEEINPFNIIEFTYSIEYQNEADNSKFFIKVSGEDKFIKNTEISNTIIRDNGQIIKLVYYNKFKGSITISSTEKGDLMKGQFYRKDASSFTLIDLFDFEDLEIDQHSKIIKKDDPKFIDALNYINNNLNSFDSTFTNWSNNSIQYSNSFFDFLSLGVKGTTEIDVQYNIAFGMILFSSIIGAVTFLASIIYILNYFHKNKKVKIKSNASLEEDNGFYEFIDTPESMRRPLPNNIKCAPLLLDRVVNALSLLLVLIGSTGLLVTAGTLFGVFTNIGASDGISYQKVVSQFIATGFFLGFFLKIDRIQTKEGVMLSSLFMFIGGLIFYIFEVLICFDLSNSQDVLSELIINLLPGNIIWSIGIFQIINFFLYNNPKWIVNNRRNAIIFRCFAIIPIVYLAICIIYKIGLYMWDFPTLHYALSSLLLSKSFMYIAFGLGFTFIMYIYRYVILRRYGKAGANIYFTGNKYLFVKNIIAVILIIGIGLFDYFGSDLSIAKAFGLTKNWYILCLIPFILFYHPHFEETNKKVNLIYNILNFAFVALPYIFIISFIL